MIKKLESLLWWGGVLCFFLFLFAVLAPPFSGTLQHFKSREQRRKMLNARFQSISLRNGRAAFVPRPRPQYVGLVRVKPDVPVLTLAKGSTFELTDGRHWSHIYKVTAIKKDGVTLEFREMVPTFLPTNSLKLDWK